MKTGPGDNKADQLRPNLLASLLYGLLTRSHWLTDYRRARRLWVRVWNKGCRMFPGPVRTTLHGRSALVNFGHPYPLTLQRYKSFNNPVVELVFRAYSAKRRPITLVDVGANIGDTILLLESRCPRMIEKFYCVDGDPEFFAYLQNNVGDFEHGELFLSLLSARVGKEGALVRTHLGTASAQGLKETPATTLDCLLMTAGAGEIDVLKTDVDGLDGQVLLGATQLLTKYRPVVIFEWHPLLCRSTSNNWSDHFDALERCGYDTFIWFTKYGEFSHYSARGEKKGIATLAELCLESKVYEDWHYDVIAMHPVSGLFQLALAELAYARGHKCDA